MNRRKALTLLGASAGALAGAGLCGGYALLPPAPSRRLGGVQDLAASLYDSLDSDLRLRACVDYDHPLRQYHNRGVRGGGAGIASWSFSREQRRILTDLLHAGLSVSGRERVPEEFFIRWPGVHLLNLLISGNPKNPPFQLILSGPHLNLRLGGKNRENVAFGGPQVYGDQRGNYVQGLPGNVYRYQFQIAHRLFESLETGQRRSAVQARSPIQTQIELQGSEGAFAGLPVRGLSKQSKGIVKELISGIFSTYPPDDVAHAWRCVDENGGIEELFLSYYEEGQVGRSGQYQIFRLEGPAAVLYFRGFPHVHAFINVGMNGDEPLSVGEIVAENRQVLEGRRVKDLFEEAMRDQTGADFAYYPEESVAGRLRKGTIRTGDIYNLESWQDSVAILEIRGSRIRGALLEHLRRRGTDPEPGRVCTVATSGYAADELAGVDLGTIESRQRGMMLRDATIAYLKKSLPA